MSVRQTLSFSLVLAIALFIFYYPWITDQSSFFLADCTYFFEPLCSYLGSSFHHLRIPLWNPLSYTGMSELAIVSPGIFYPFNLLFAAFPFSQALGWQFFLQQLMAGIGGFLLVGDLEWGPLAQIIGALLLSLGGYMFGVETNYTLAASAAWIPLTIWSLRKFTPDLDPPPVKMFWLASLGIYLIWTGGRPEIAIPATCLIGCCVLLGCLKSISRRSIKRLSWQLLSITTGLLLAMPMIIPALEWTSLSPRAQGLTFNDVFMWSTSWYDCLCLFLLQPLGDLTRFGSRYLPVITNMAVYSPFLSSAYLGPSAITLAIWALADRTWKERWWLLLALMIFMVLALGSNSPIAPALYRHWAQLGLFRIPVKLLVFPAGILSFMAARGASAAIRGHTSNRAIWLSLSVWLVLMGAGIASVQTHGTLINLASCLGLHRDPALLRDAEVLIGHAAIFASSIGIATAAAGYLFSLRIVKARMFSLLLISAVLCPLLLSAFMFNRHPAPKDFFQRESSFRAKTISMVSAASHSDGFRLLPLFFAPITRPLHYQGSAGLDDTAAFYEYGRQILVPSTNMGAELPISSGYESGETASYRKLYWGAMSAMHLVLSDPHILWAPATKSLAMLTGSPGYAPEHALNRFLKLTATGFVATPAVRGGFLGTPITEVPRLDPAFFKLVIDDRGMNARLYRARQSNPRFYFSSRVVNMGSQDDFIQSILSLKPGADPLATTYLMPSDKPPEVLAASDTDRIDLVQDLPERLALRTHTSGSRLLVCADNFYPGWQVTVDGAPTKLLQANLINRAVGIPAGAHAVIFEYRPLGLYTGLALMLLGLSIPLIVYRRTNYRT